MAPTVLLGTTVTARVTSVATAPARGNATRFGQTLTVSVRGAAKRGATWTQRRAKT